MITNKTNALKLVLTPEREEEVLQEFLLGYSKAVFSKTFSTYPCDERLASKSTITLNFRILQRIVEAALEYGVVFYQKTFGGISLVYPEQEVVKTAKDYWGVPYRYLATTTFFKKFSDVLAAEREGARPLYQFFHYLTAALFDAGLISEESIYAPNLSNLPILATVNDSLTENEESILSGVLDSKKLNFIEVVSKNQGLAKMVRSVKTLKAFPREFSDTLQKEIVAIAAQEIDSPKEISSNEIKNLFYSVTGTIPKDPEEFFRFAISQVTLSPLVIKSQEIIEALSRKIKYNYEFKMYRSLYETILRASEDPVLTKALSASFLRKKEYWLAIKRGAKQFTIWTQREIAGILTSGGEITQEVADKAKAFKSYPTLISAYINKLRRLAKDNHKPLNLKNSVLGFSQMTPSEKLEFISKTTSIPNLIKLGNFCLSADKPEKLYLVRNGKMFFKEGSLLETKGYSYLADKIKWRIAELLVEKFRGKNVIIKKNTEVDIAMPTTTKQFIGAYPWGSCVTVFDLLKEHSKDKKVIVGIHWENGDGRTDIDIHGSSVEADFGWNTRWVGNKIIYSGDMTDAPSPQGATEAYQIGVDDESTYNFYTHLYSGRPKGDMFQLFFVTNDKADESVKKEKATGLFNPKNLALAPIPIKISRASFYTSENLGIFSKGEFYFASAASFQSFNVRLTSEMKQKGFEAMLNRFKNSMKVNDIIDKMIYLSEREHNGLVRNIRQVETEKQFSDAMQSFKRWNEILEEEKETIVFDLSSEMISQETLMKLFVQDLNSEN